MKKVARQDRLGLRAQELRPGRPGPSRRGAGAVGSWGSPNGRRRYLHSQPGQFPVDPAVAPSGVLPGQPEDQGLDVPAGGRAGLAAHGPGGLAAADDVAVPAHDRVRGDQQPQPLAPRFRYHAEQGRGQGPVRPVHSGRRGCRRCRTASWWRRIKISAVFHASSRRDSRSHAASRVIRRNTNRRHMIGDHHGRSAGRATLLVRAVDAILGTHRPDECSTLRDGYWPGPIEAVRADPTRVPTGCWTTGSDFGPRRYVGVPVRASRRPKSPQVCSRRVNHQN